MNAPVLILGAGGQVGRALAKHLGESAITATRKDCDLSAPDFIAQLERFTGNRRLAAVYNAAAYTEVDKAESEAELAFRVNCEAVGELAGWCKARGLPLVHFSTDYVFDGKSRTPYTETAQPYPLNIYGRSKLAGEERIRDSGADYLIFRTSWVYSGQGRNFYTAMLRLFKEREILRVVSDQCGSPTYAPHLAAAAIQALSHALSMPIFPSGIYHLCHNGTTSRHAFAEAIFALAKACDTNLVCRRIEAICADEARTAARRPPYSGLDCTKAKKCFGIALPDWHEGLARCINETYGNQKRQH